jgi:hypothetical protein
MHNILIATLFMAMVVAPAFAVLTVFEDKHPS